MDNDQALGNNCGMMEVHIWGRGIQIFKMVKEHSKVLMANHMKVVGNLENLMVKENLNGLMANDIQASINKT